MPPRYEQKPKTPKLWRTVGHYSLTLLMEVLYLLGIIFVVVGVLCTPPLLLLSLWNWVRTRRLGLLLLLLLATGLVLQVATAGGGGIIHWPYPAIVAILGVAMLLIRLWPRWRLLKNPLPKRVPPRTSVARGVLDSYAWPKKNTQGMTTVSVLIASVMVLVVAGAGVSCLTRAAQVSRSAQRSFVATTLLHAEFERLRAGAVTVADVERDLSLRASRLLPNAGARTRVTRQGTVRLFECNLEISWQETGRPRRAAALAGLVYTGGSQR